VEIFRGANFPDYALLNPARQAPHTVGIAGAATRWSWCRTLEQCHQCTLKGRAKSHASRKAHRDFLQQQAVAVRVAERGPRAIRAAFWIGTWNACLCTCVTEEPALVMEHFADFDPMSDELSACQFDVIDDQHEVLGRARLGRCRALATEHREAGGVSWITRKSSLVSSPRKRWAAT
jgi:hypothetical protein